MRREETFLEEEERQARRCDIIVTLGKEGSRPLTSSPLQQLGSTPAPNKYAVWTMG
jgi:hypothetical protein